VDAELTARHFDEHEAESKRLVGLGLILMAYELTLKCSHLFNLLDARGAIGVNQRAEYIARVRGMARACCWAWMESVTPEEANEDATS
jgi:glycyl-tRNA synthetase alpha chain